MEDFSSLLVSPSKLRLSYHISHKSTRFKATSNRKESFETGKNLHRYSITPNRSKTFNLSSQITKLQEELDSEELALKLKEFKNCSEEEKNEGEKQVYKTFIENFIKVILQDPETAVIAKALRRGWKGFLKTSENLSKLNQKPAKIKKKVIKSDNFTQTFEETILEEDKDLTLYINSLHNLAKNLNQMQTSKIIEKLRQLNNHLKPVDIPSPSRTPEVFEFDLTDTVKVIHTKLKARFKASSKVEVPEVLTQDSAVQTFVRLDDFKLIEGFRQTLEEKENIILELMTRARKLQETEDLLKNRSKELEDIRSQLVQVKSEGCAYCKVKREQLETTGSQIRQLQMTVNKGLGVERELEITKKKLTDSLTVISQNNSKISSLTQNVQILSVKVQETRAQKEALEKKLTEEEKLRENVEIQLKKEIEVNYELKKNTVQSKKQRNEVETVFFSSQESSAPSQSTTPINKLQPNKSSSRSPLFPPSNQSITPDRRQFLSFKSEERTQIPEIDSESPKTTQKSFQTFQNIKIFHPTKEGENFSKITKKHWIMKHLKINKQEYLSLTKQERLEIFQALFEHKEKCGSDCEHLKRAMQIRFRNKNPLFPTKKYNIS
jgi:hypothetical protein